MWSQGCIVVSNISQCACIGTQMAFVSDTHTHTIHISFRLDFNEDESRKKTSRIYKQQNKICSCDRELWLSFPLFCCAAAATGWSGKLNEQHTGFTLFSWFKRIKTHHNKNKRDYNLEINFKIFHFANVIREQRRKKNGGSNNNNN